MTLIAIAQELQIKVVTVKARVQDIFRQLKFEYGTQATVVVPIFQNNKIKQKM